MGDKITTFGEAESFVSEMSDLHLGAISYFEQLDLLEFAASFTKWERRLIMAALVVAVEKEITDSGLDEL